MKIEKRLNEWKEKVATNIRLIKRVLGFFLIFYAFLIIVDYNSYGLGIPITLLPIITFGLLIVGIFLILTKGAK